MCIGRVQFCACVDNLIATTSFIFIRIIIANRTGLSMLVIERLRGSLLDDHKLVDRHEEARRDKGDE